MAMTDEERFRFDLAGFLVRTAILTADEVAGTVDQIDRKEDGGAHFIVGSHKANFPMHPDHMSLEMGKRSQFLMSYDCPAGSAIFFTENLCHAGPV